MSLKPLVKKIRNFDTYGYDIETYGDSNDFVLATLYKDEQNYKTFLNKDDFINELLHNHTEYDKSKIFCHNLQFDFCGTFTDIKHFKNFQIISRGSDFILAKSYVYDNKFNFMTNKSRNQSTINFCDTMNFFKGSLEKAGKIIGMNKLDKPDFLGQKPKTCSQWDELIKYNINDARVTKHFAEYLQNSFNSLGSELKNTIASQSMDLFKRKYLHDEYYIPKIDIIKKQYLPYSGGRTEIFNRGYTTEKINVYDFNSLYPSVMHDFEYPNPNYMRKSYRINLPTVQNYDGWCFAKFQFNENVKIPYLQQKTKTKLIFPKGTVQGYYTFLEIRKAIENNYKLLSLKDGYYFTRNVDLFKNFVSDIYGKRMSAKHNNSSIETALKILLNSLYGKFATKLEQSELKHEDNLTYQEYKNGEEIGQTKMFRIKKETPQNRISFIMPIISAYVTAYARDKLYSAMNPISDNVFYCDTDSIFTTKILPTGEGLGKLKLEYSTKQAFLIKPKFYYLETESQKEISKIKGVHGINTKQQFSELYRDKQVIFNKFTRYKESLIQGIPVNFKRDVTKHLDFEDTKRDWLGNKISFKDFQESKPLLNMIS